MVAYQTTSTITFVGWDRSEQSVPQGTVYFPSAGVRVSPGSEPQPISPRETDYLNSSQGELMYGVSASLRTVGVPTDQATRLLALNPSSICDAVSRMGDAKLPERRELPRFI